MQNNFYVRKRGLPTIFLGIDPGQSGGLGILMPNQDMIYLASAIPFKNQTEKDIIDNFDFILDSIADRFFAVIENVHSMPKQGVSSSFKFGKNFGCLLGCLYCHRIPFEMVSPQKWQKEMQCLSHGNKNITKAMAQRLFPQIKITHAIADALLITEYAKRIWYQRNK